ncbi:hypothetical protein BHOIPH791_02210 [Bartonella henselae]|uniref:Protein-disulfide reductase n=1 Tax=Bartonella henselae (strain ATCC 49882 / DSM 28221 / CCUG 30454 / Houston 1) TaxID=283166 RepID=A0A0H3LXS1_BARHE|nr:hypothetical protein [Bartonella henselae]ATP12061.1 hypothetical protein BhenCHDE101_02340 [Bartonella henselae]ETS09991.1 hypothetical protein Q654_00270 [Bartonella henselae JK 50]ETS10501.1 hypothetical protein Q655_00221 [Bartonella henselae JK 51]MDM9990495.1 hypothetical protein [Bartonella henselae]OLL39709.1 hypothetical protein AT237_00550 [Bartonella henselae]
MVKVLKNQVFSIFIVTFFSFSQIISVSAHASPLKNSPQQENISVSVMEQGKKIAINMATFYMPNFTYEAKNEAALEGKVEKVVEPITIGIFGIGMAIGYATTAVGLLFGWIINLIIYKTK